MQPVVTALRHRFGQEVVIDLICLKRSLPAALLLNGLDALHTIEKGTSEVLPELRERQYDFLLDLHGNVRSRALAKSLDAFHLAVDKQAWQRWQLRVGWRKDAVPPFVHRCFALLRPFGIDLPPAEHYGQQAWGTLALPPEKLDMPLPHHSVVLGLGASHPGKHLSHDVVHSCIKLAHALDRPVVLVGGEDVAARAEMLHKTYPAVTNSVGAWSLGQTAAAIQVADAVISGDSVTMHLASASGTPIASVWGCTRPTLGLHPWRPHPSSVAILPLDPEPSRPCSKHGATCRHTRSKDPFDHARCSQKVQVSEVTDWLANVLAQTPSVPLSQKEP